MTVRSEKYVELQLEIVFVLLWENSRQALLKRVTNVVWLLLYKLFIPGKLTPVSAKLQTHTRSVCLSVSLSPPLSLYLSHTHTHAHFTQF